MEQKEDLSSLESEPLADPAGSDPSAPSSSRRRWSSPLAVGLVAALVTAGVAAGGFLAGRATGDDGPAGGSAVVSATPGLPDSSPRTDTSDAAPILVVNESDEPVAAVARALTPSVVQIKSEIGLGSGVIYDADEGLILTAAHVVNGTDRAQVLLSDGTRLTGTVLGADDGTDVGVVQVASDGLVAAPLAEGIPLEIGQMAVAIGSPFGLDGTVTAGVVSAGERAVTGPDGRSRMLIQTDAAINPGNSGGALADREGRVIGINDLIVSRSGGNEGVGFAIPIEVALRAARSIVAGEPVEAGFLGVTGTEPETGRSGALITGVIDGSAAEAAGVQIGDLVIAVDDTVVGSVDGLAAAVQTREPGTTVILEIIRGGQTIELAVVLDARPED